MALDVLRTQAQGLADDATARIGLEFDEHLAGLIVVGGHVVDARGAPGQRPAVRVGGKKPAAPRIRADVVQQRGQHLLQLSAAQALGLWVVQHLAQAAQQRGAARGRVGIGLIPQPGQPRQRCGSELLHGQLGMRAQAQLVFQARQRGEFACQNARMGAVDTQLHADHAATRMPCVLAAIRVAFVWNLSAT